MINRNSGLRKIDDIKKPCYSSQHNPPSHMYLPLGVYEYVCPKCGNRVVFTVPEITCQTIYVSKKRMKSYFSEGSYDDSN